MRLRTKNILFTISMLCASPLACAHGTEGVVQPLVITAVVIGFLGGIVTGAMNAHPGHGLMSSFGVLFIAVMIYLMVDAFSPSMNFLGIMGMMLIIIAFAGGIPLVIAYIASFTMSSVVRTRIWPEKKREHVKASD